MKTYSVFNQNSQEFIAKGVTINDLSKLIPAGSRLSAGSRKIKDEEGAAKEVRGGLYTLLSSKILVTEDDQVEEQRNDQRQLL